MARLATQIAIEKPLTNTEPGSLLPFTDYQQVRDSISADLSFSGDDAADIHPTTACSGTISVRSNGYTLRFTSPASWTVLV